MSRKLGEYFYFKSCLYMLDQWIDEEGSTFAELRINMVQSFKEIKNDLKYCSNNSRHLKKLWNETNGCLKRTRAAFSESNRVYSAEVVDLFEELYADLVMFVLIYSINDNAG